jgi:hypothetical protein
MEKEKTAYQVHLDKIFAPILEREKKLIEEQKRREEEEKERENLPWYMKPSPTSIFKSVLNGMG